MNNLLDSNNGLRVVGIEKQFTRQFRTGESASQQVHQEDMFRDIGRGNFLYFMNAHGNWYYTPLQNIAKALDKGSNALLELPSRVALELKRLLPNLVTTFLIVPPKTAAGRYDEEVLAGRLRDRMEDVGKIQERVVTGRDALVEADRFDYVIENPQAKAGEKLADAATREIEAVIRARETSSKVSFQGRMNAFNPFILLSPAQVA